MRRRVAHIDIDLSGGYSVISRAVAHWLGAALLATATTVVAIATRRDRATISRLIAEAGLPIDDPWRRLSWLARASRRLLGGWLRRAAGRAFDRRAGDYRSGGLVFAIPRE